MISKCISGVLIVSATAMLAAQSPGYDRAAERTISGTIKSVGSFPATDGAVGVHIDLRTPDGLVEISVAPAVFIGQNNFWFFADDQVVITGAPERGSDGLLRARVVQKGSQLFVARTDAGAPKWTPANEGVDGCGVNHLPVQRTTLH